MSCTLAGLPCGPKYTIDRDLALQSTSSEVITPFDDSDFIDNTVAISLNPTDINDFARSSTPLPSAPGLAARPAEVTVQVAPFGADGQWQGKEVAYKEIWNRYVRGKCIGSGAFGDVFEVMKYSIHG